MSRTAGALLGGSNMAAVHLANAVGGDLMMGFISAVAFATILAVVAGLTLAGASAVSHDLYASVFRKGHADESGGTAGLEDHDGRRSASSPSCSASCSRRQRRLHGGPRLRDRRQRQFPGAAAVDVLEGAHDRGAVIGGFLGLLSAVVLTVLARRFGRWCC